MCLGIPGRVLDITDAANNLAICDFSGVKRVVNLACVVDEAHTIEQCLGEWVLVHVGFAMSRINQAEAKATLALMESLGAVGPELAAMTAKD